MVQPQAAAALGKCVNDRSTDCIGDACMGWRQTEGVVTPGWCGLASKPPLPIQPKTVVLKATGEAQQGVFSFVANWARTALDIDPDAEETAFDLWRSFCDQFPRGREGLGGLSEAMAVRLFAEALCARFDLPAEDGCGEVFGLTSSPSVRGVRLKARPATASVDPWPDQAPAPMDAGRAGSTSVDQPGVAPEPS